MYKNELRLKFPSLIENEGFARLAVASFCSCRVVDIEVLTDIKTAVSEAVTNCCVHAYPDDVGEIEICVIVLNDKITIIIEDNGVGIGDLSQAMKPFYTSKPEMERSGMGFTVMEGFMDTIDVVSKVNEGTVVTMIKNI